MAIHRGLDDPNSLSDKIAELREDLRHRLTLNDLNISERYRDGDLYVMVDFSSGGIGYEAIFGAVPNLAGWEFALTGRDCEPTQGNADCDQVGVFIDEIQVMQDTEQITVPSVVWLQIGNSATDEFGNFLAFAAQRDFEPRFVFSMGEISILRRLTREHGAATNRLVESGAQVVEGVCRCEPKIAGQWLRKPNFESIARLRVYLGSKSYDVRIREGFEGVAVITDVLFGPFNL
jgi:hypothetical protein